MKPSFAILILTAQFLLPGHLIAQSPPATEERSRDYIRLVEQHFSSGVTPENNLFANLVKLAPIDADDTNLKKQLYEKLGVEVPEDANLIKSFDQWMESRRTDEPRESWETALRAARDGPWSPDDHPLIDQWVNELETALVSVVAASKVKKSFAPLIFVEDNRYLLANRLLLINTVRLVKDILLIRANRNCGQKQFEPWLVDIKAASRFALAISKGHTTMHTIAGIAYFTHRNNAIAAAIRSGDFTASELQKLRATLVSMPQVSSLKETLTFGVRYAVLDSVRLIKETKQMSKLLDDAVVRALVGEIEIDWSVAEEAASEVYAMVDAVMAHDTLVKQRAAAAVMEDELQEIGDGLMANVVTDLKDARTASEWFGKAAAGRGIPALRILLGTQARHETEKVMLITAIDLELFRLANQKYPTKLEQLIPVFRTELPLDFHWGNALFYKRVGAGHSLYGLGKNGLDDGGEEYRDCSLSPFLSPKEAELPESK